MRWVMVILTTLLFVNACGEDDLEFPGRSPTNTPTTSATAAATATPTATPTNTPS